MTLPPIAVRPAGSEAGCAALALSPGILSGDHLFVTGMTGSEASGDMPTDAATQFHNAFGKIGLVLAEAGLGFQSIVEMTSYHIGIRAHFDLFSEVRRSYVCDPFPAWTAVGVAELRRPGALVEIRVIAHRPQPRA